MADIVFADDEKNNRFVIAEHLKLHGHTVRLAADGAEALALIQAQRPDVVILDLMMPKVDGFEACRRLRADGATASLPVVAMTALDSPDTTALEQCRFDAILTKPFLMAQLHELMQELTHRGAPN